MALKRLVLLQMQTFVNMIYFSILIHGNAMKICIFHFNCTAIVYICSRNRFKITVGRTKSFPQYSYKHYIAQDDTV